MPLQFGPTAQTSPRHQNRPGLRASMASDGTLEIMVYGDIVDSATVSMLEAWGYPSDGLISAASIKKQIDDAGDYSQISLRINSPGGDAFEGIAAYNILRAQGKPVNVYVDAIAASSASIIAMAGDTITMGPNCMMMIHNAWAAGVGDASEHRKLADVLDKVSESIGATYVQKTGKSADEVKELMDAETWMSAQDCMKNGFCTHIAEQADDQAMAMARGFKTLAKLRNVPAALRVDQMPRNEAKTKRVDGEDLTWSEFIIALDHEDIDTWHLPWKFSTVDKTKSHLRDALARFNQVEGLTNEQKHAAWTKLVRLCKKYGIEVSVEDSARYQVWAKIENGDEPCECSCDNCQQGDCGNCSNEDCNDPNCEDCPMQAAANDAAKTPNPEKSTETRNIEAAATDETDNNLSLYQAKVKMLGRRR